MDNLYDIVIIGSGAGGGTLAYALKDSQLKILLIEQGDFLPQEEENWSKEEVFKKRRYMSPEKWMDLSRDKEFAPTQVNYVGGKTKLYGAALLRMREQDFSELTHYEGISPEWPISYSDLEPFYTKAEKIYRVHGQSGVEPHEPHRSSDYPYPALPRDQYINNLEQRLKEQNVTPSSIPIGIDLREGGKCIFCKTCDGFPCKLLAKSDADVCCVGPAINSGNVELMTKTKAMRLIMDEHNKISAVEVFRNDEISHIKSKFFVVCCGAIGSAALLLKSKNKFCPNGVGNSSGLVGRNLMFRNKSILFGIHFTKKNPTEFQKILQVMDYYLGSKNWPYPMGIMQSFGYFPLEYFMPRLIGEYIKKHSMGFFAMSEDLPDASNRVVIQNDGKIGIEYKSNNLVTHKKLVQRFRNILRQCGYSYVLAAKGQLPKDSGGHECGTIRFGTDSKNSVLDIYCRSHDIKNLYVVDASFFPSSAAVNPALTIMAQSLRVGEHLKTQIYN